VRKEAERAGLPTHTKKDSQGLCFLGHVDIHEFLSHYIPLEHGNVLNEAGEIVGSHDGALLYTKGERHGFRIRERTSKTLPHYVTERDIYENTITVSPTPPSTKDNTKIMLDDVHSFGHGIPSRCDAVFRYHGARIPVTFHEGTSGSGILIPDGTVIEYPTSGQIAVLYRGSECVGSGIIR
jgi:tRNA-specific 2-thiouridylase